MFAKGTVPRNRTLWVACRLIAEYFFSDPYMYTLDAIQECFWIPPSVSRVTGPGRRQGRALEHGLVAFIMGVCKKLGIRMRSRDSSDYFVDDSAEAKLILAAMRMVAEKLCKSLREEMHNCVTDLSRRAFALYYRSTLSVSVQWRFSTLVVARML